MSSAVINLISLTMNYIPRGPSASSPSAMSAASVCRGPIGGESREGGDFMWRAESGEKRERERTGQDVKPNRRGQSLWAEKVVFILMDPTQFCFCVIGEMRVMMPMPIAWELFNSLASNEKLSAMSTQ